MLLCVALLFISFQGDVFFFTAESVTWSWWTWELRCPITNGGISTIATECLHSSLLLKKHYVLCRDVCIWEVKTLKSSFFPLQFIRHHTFHRNAVNETTVNSSWKGITWSSIYYFLKFCLVHNEDIYKWTSFKKYPIENTIWHLKTRDAKNNSFLYDCSRCFSGTYDSFAILNVCFGRIISLVFIHLDIFF